MITDIDKEFDFDAAHLLDRLPKEHKCSRLHGHTYRVVITLRGEPDPTTGFVIDYEFIEAAWKTVHAAIDHRFLNDIEGLAVPSTELVAEWIWKRIKIVARIGDMLYSVRVFESATTSATVRG